MDCDVGAAAPGSGHSFYTRLNAVLDAASFDQYVEGQCRRFYAPLMGRSGVARAATCASCWWATRRFLHVRLEDTTPDHSTISRTRRLIDVETHRAVFTWGSGSWSRTTCSMVRRSRWTRRRSKRMRRCGVSCAATRRHLLGLPDAVGRGVGDHDADA